MKINKILKNSLNNICIYNKDSILELNISHNYLVLI